MRSYLFVGTALVVFLVLCTGAAVAQEEAAEVAGQPVVAQAPAEAPAEAPADTDEDPLASVVQMPENRELTLGRMIEEGGYILWIIMALSVMTFIMVMYFFFTITPGREVPGNLVKRTLAQIREGDLRGAYQLCDGREELLARVVKAGLKMSGHDRYVIQEAMESEGERGATALWQKISYINNVGVIAPLLGLLGTVWGMIRAFGAIAFDDSQVKGLTMAYSVAQAMITTAAGLMLAIPAMVAYFYLRGRVVKIVSEVEAHASEVVEVLTRGQS